MVHDLPAGDDARKRRAAGRVDSDACPGRQAQALPARAMRTSPIGRPAGPARRLGLAAAVLLLALRGVASPVETVPEPPPTTTLPVPVAIPTAHVPAAAEATSAQLRDIRSRLEADPAIVAVEATLPATVEHLHELATDPRTQIGPSMAPTVLRDVESRWTAAREALGEWKATLAARTQTLDAGLAQLHDLRERWQRTRDAPGAAELPPALRVRVRGTLDEIADVEKRIRERRDALLTLQDRVSREEVAVADALGRIEGVREALRRKLLAYDSPPLWEAIRESHAEGPIGGGAVISLREEAERLGEFARAQGTRLVVEVILFLAVLGLTIDLRRRVRTWTVGDERFEASARILSRPASAAFLIALLATPWFFPHAPKLLRDLAGLLTLIPILRLLPPAILTSMRGALVTLVAFYVTDQLRDLAPPQSLLQRLLLLVEGAFAGAGLVWLLRTGRLARLPARVRWARALQGAGWVLLAAVGVSLVANVLGNVSLATLLTGASLKSAYLAVALYAGTLVLDGIVAVGLRTRPARRLRAVRLHGELLRRRATAGVHAAMTFAWVAAVLTLFGVRGALVAALGDVLGARLTIGSATVSLGDGVAFGLTVWVSFLLARFVRFLLEEDVLPRVSLPRGVPAAISASAHHLVLLFGFVLAVVAAGVDLGRFTLLAGAFGVGIGFGLQNVVHNFVSGLILLFERPIQLGDTIEIGALIGDVRRIGVRSSTIRTWEGAEVIVPNGNLISDQIINWTLSDRHRRIDLAVGVAYGSDPQRVLDLLLEVARADPATLPEPPPVALFLGFGDSSLDFSLRFWTSHFESWFVVKSDVAVSVHAALREAGIEIPFPQRDLHLRSVAPAARAALGGEPDDA
jgi:potassium-dependent mechanosensitive channel